MIKTVNPDNNESDNAGGNAIQERSAFISAVKKHYDNHAAKKIMALENQIAQEYAARVAAEIKYESERAKFEVEKNLLIVSHAVERATMQDSLQETSDLHERSKLQSDTLKRRLAVAQKSKHEQTIATAMATSKAASHFKKALMATFQASPAIAETQKNPAAASASSKAVLHFAVGLARISNKAKKDGIVQKRATFNTFDPRLSYSNGIIELKKTTETLPLGAISEADITGGDGGGIGDGNGATTTTTTASPSSEIVDIHIHPHYSASTELAPKFAATTIRLGQPEQAALGLADFMGVDSKTLGSYLVDPMAAIQKEIEENGKEVDKMNLKGLLDGSYRNPPDHALVERVKRCEAAVHDQGEQPLSPQDVKELEEARAKLKKDTDEKQAMSCISLDEMMLKEQVKTAKLERHHVLALRLYTTSSYSLINNPLRTIPPTTPHPLAATTYFISNAIKKLRAVGAKESGAFSPKVLWRGLSGVNLETDFLVHGGTEFGCMYVHDYFET